MIFATSGLPGSGKSKWARAYATTNAIPYFNADLLAEMLFNAPYNPKVNVKDLMLDFVEVWRRRYGADPIMIDWTFTTKASRKRLMDRFPNDNIEWHYFDTPLSVCIERNAHRKNSIPESVIASMDKSLEKPTLKEAIYHS